MTRMLVIAAGGAAGSLLRYWMSTAVYAIAGTRFPWGTLAVNVLGSFVFGALIESFAVAVAPSAEIRALIFVGVLGSFTTFSAFLVAQAHPQCADTTDERFGL